jgi:pantoate--beta-alanine ligase
MEQAVAAARASVEAAGFTVDYIEARHAETLAPVASTAEGPVRLLAAAKLGRTRLIDNIAV